MIKQTYYRLLVFWVGFGGFFLFVCLFEKQEPGDGRKAMNIKKVLWNSGAARHHGRLWNYAQMCITHGS